MSREITYAQAISEATTQGMKKNPHVFVMGLGVDDHKGIFNTTREAFKKFGPRRVVCTPASENAMTGVAIGAALNGKRPILVHARNDFMFLALDQMINNAAKWKYNFCGTSVVPLVVRAIIGKGWGQGPTHSQSIQSLFVHIPGLLVAMPSTPYDVKGILLKSLEAEAPVVIFEHRSLYNIKGEVPSKPYTIEFGKARIVRSGTDVTVVAISAMVCEAVKAADILQRQGIHLEIIDPVSLSPLDETTIIHSIKKTGRLVCIDTSWRRCSFASEIAAVAAERAVNFLKNPVCRIHVKDCPAPVSEKLEWSFYPNYFSIVEACCKMLNKPIAMKKEVHRQTQLDFVGPY